MKDLIEALTIFLKYGNPAYPTSCDHDILRVYINPEKVSQEDKKLLETLGFEVEEENDCFYSFRYGSC